MHIPDSFAPYVYITVLVIILFVSFLLYRLWVFLKQLVYHLMHRPARTVHLSSGASVRLLPDREWRVEPETEEDNATSSRMQYEQPEEPEPEELTPREKEVARLAKKGMSNKAIAEQLNISVNTVENHMTNIHRKLHIESRKELKYVPRDMLQ